MTGVRAGDLGGCLDRAAVRGEQAIRSARRAAALHAGVAVGGRTAVLGAMLLLLYAVGRAAGGDTLPPVTLVGGLVLVFLPAVTVVALLVGNAHLQKVRRADALGWVDARLGLEDRLLTAEEFRQITAPGPFAAAALEDAVPAAKAAAETPLEPEPTEPFPRPRRALVALAVVCCALAFWVDPPGRASPGAGGAEVAQVGGSGAAPRTTPDDEPESPEDDPPRVREREKRAEELLPSPEGEAGKPSTSLPEAAKETRGTTGTGAPADAPDSSGATQSKGVPSGQGQESSAAPRASKKKPKKPSAKPDAQKQEQPKARTEQQSGATAGSGSASGSNRNPAGSEWASKDQVTDTEDDPVENDEDVEDEDSDSEARGGVQPSLRDRRPAVNRDLTIGFGNQPSPDANGRGGPGQMKKSRGVASLVLGVPIPDHVKGQPNAGKTKITQERVQPREEDAPPVDAGARSARDAPVGPVERLALEPWMCSFLRAYFISLREAASRNEEQSKP